MQQQPGSFHFAAPQQQPGLHFNLAAPSSQAAFAELDPVAEFVMRWGLDSECVTILEKVSEDVRARVLADFAPRDGTQNVSGKFKAFVRTVATGEGRTMPKKAPAQQLQAQAYSSYQMPAQSSAAVPSSDFLWGQSVQTVQTTEAQVLFLAQWGLHETPAAAEVLARLDPRVCNRVMAEFLPGQGTSNMLGKLSGFAASVARAAEHEAKTGQGDAIQAFVERWGLDARSHQIMLELDEDTRMRVVTEFEPRGDTRNPSGKFMAFVKTVVSGQGRSLPKAQPAQDPQAQFLAQWGLAGQPAAANILERLQPAVRARVMAEFLPGQDTGNMLGKLSGFAASVGRAAENEAANGLPPLRAPRAGQLQAPLAAPGATAAAVAAPAWPSAPAGCWLQSSLGSSLAARGVSNLVGLLQQTLAPSPTGGASARVRAPCWKAWSLGSRPSSLRSTCRAWTCGIRVASSVRSHALSKLGFAAAAPRSGCLPCSLGTTSRRPSGRGIELFTM